MKAAYTFIGLLIVVSLGAILWQYHLVGPAKADSDLVNRLNTAQGSIRNYADHYKRLPLTLNDLTIDRSGLEYHVVGTNDFELCGVFQTDASGGPIPAMAPADGYIDFSHHGRGRQCLTGRVDLPTPAPTLRPL